MSIRKDSRRCIERSGYLAASIDCSSWKRRRMKRRKNARDRRVACVSVCVCIVREERETSQNRLVGRDEIACYRLGYLVD
jgi:hypothetical protein